MRLAREVPDEQPIDPTIPRDEDQPDETVEDVEVRLACLTADDEPRTVGSSSRRTKAFARTPRRTTSPSKIRSDPGGLGPEDQALYRTDSP